MKDRLPGKPGQCKANITAEELQKLQNGEEFVITLVRDDQPIVEGTPYSKAAVLPDELAVQICPGQDDPSPKDAFASLQSKKAEGLRKSYGSYIKLQDSATAPLHNLRIFGNETGRRSVPITVTGKNLANIYAYSAGAIAEEGGSILKNNAYGTYVINTHPPASLRFTQSKAEEPDNPTSVQNGYCMVSLNNKLDVGKVVTVSFDVTVDDDLLNTSIIGLAPGGLTVTTAYIENGKVKCTLPWARASGDYYEYLEIRNCGKSMTITNIQIEYGEVATDYVPAQEVKTVEIDVPVALYEMKSDGDIRDEMDFERGVFIQRVGVDKPVETPLYSSDRTAVAWLHSYAPETLIYSPLDMEVTYYTPKTALPMQQGASRKGKLLGINDEGYVDFVNSSEAGGSSVPTEVAEHLTDTNNPHKVTAKQLGAVTTEELEERLANFEGGGGITEEELADKIADILEEQNENGGRIDEHLWTLATAVAYSESRYALEEFELVSHDEDTDEYSRNVVTFGELEEAVGDIETALDAILAIQNELIGGDGV